LLFKKKIRQKELTRYIQKKTKNFFYKNYTHDYSLINILLKSNFFLFPKDASIFIKCNFVYINNKKSDNINFLLGVGDCIQIQVFSFFYIYFLFFRKFLKQKIFFYKKSAWLFFKKNFLNKKVKSKKIKKRKNPKYLYLLYIFKLNIPQYLDVDFITLTSTILKKFNIQKHKTYFLNKNFSWKLFQLYNFKKMN
jgi:hypothetical protein